jgi:serine/threonine protein kinase/tetratricopeptide (TPR) repeat protein
MIANRYEYIELLGQGGMGAVHKVKDRLTGDIVALKQVSIPPTDLRFAARIKTNPEKSYIALTREFQTLAGLRHPNIISVLDYGYDDKHQPFYTMEYIKDHIDIHQFSLSIGVNAKVHLLIQLLQGLAYLHRRQIVHKDLKPGNIMVVDDCIKVLDFGLAIIQQEVDVTQTSTITGTIPYMAPELLFQKDASIASDLYAVGVIAYQMFSGNHPFNIGNPGKLLTAVLTQVPDVWTIGLPEKLAIILEQLLEKAPEKRYDSAPQVIQALYHAIEEDAPPESFDIRQSYLQAAEFVGREYELNLLEQSLDEAIIGSGATWLVAGESGIGKSRLLDELRIRALVKGAIVLRGQGVEGGGVPFQLWRDIARHLIFSAPMSPLEKSILKEIIPDIATLLGEDVPDAPTLNGTNQQQRLSLTLVELIKRQEKPLVLLLEDLQWSVGSLQAINYLNASVSNLSLLIIGNYRNDEAPKLPKQLPDMPIVPLNRLDEHEIAELSASMLGDVGKQPQVLDLLSQETEGNCFFMVEVVQALAEEAGRLIDIGRMTLPNDIFVGGIYQVVHRRLDRIPIWGRNLLKLAALVGRQLDLQIMQFVIRQHSQFLSKPHSLEDWLAICTDCAVLDMQDQRWRFSHDKLREVVLQDINDDSIPKLSRAIAEAIEAIYPDNDDYHEILLNFWRKVGDFDKELNYIYIVAEHLISTTRMDYVRASQLLERGLELLPADDPKRIKLLNWQCQSISTQGDHDLATRFAQQALQLAQELSDEKGIADSLTNLGGIAENQSDHTQAQDYHLQSLQMYQTLNDQLGIANSLNNLGVIAFSLNDYKQSEAYFQQSLGIYEELDDLRNTARLLNNLANIYDVEGDYKKGRVYQHRALNIIHQLGDHLGLAISYNNLGLLEFDQGNYSEADEYNQNGLVIFQQINHPRGIAAGLSNNARIAYENADFSKAQDYQQKSLSIRQEINHKNGIVVCLGDLGKIAYAQKEYPRAQDYFEQSLTLAQSIDAQDGIINGLNSLGLIAYHYNNFDKAHELHQQALTIAQSIESQPHIANTHIHIAYVYLKQQDSRAQQALVEILTIAQIMQSTVLQLQAIVGFAWLYIQQETPVNTAKLIGFVQAHPFQANRIQMRIDEVRPQLDNAFDSIELKVILQRGSRLDLDTVVQDLLDESSDRE